MNKYEPTYETGIVLQNNITDEQMVIQDMRFNKQLVDIVYKVQGKRFKFKMWEIPETIITQNIEHGDYEVLDK